MKYKIKIEKMIRIRIRSKRDQERTFFLLHFLLH